MNVNVVLPVWVTANTPVLVGSRFTVPLAEGMEVSVVAAAPAAAQVAFPSASEVRTSPGEAPAGICSGGVPLNVIVPVATSPADESLSTAPNP